MTRWSPFRASSLSAEGTLIAHRLLLSGVAVSLMWVSSLSVAVRLAERFIAQPSTSLVEDECRHAYEVAKDERRDYTRCVELQTNQCTADFDRSLATALAQMRDSFATNEAALADYEAVQAACSQAVTFAQAAVSEWQTLDMSHVVPYRCPNASQLESCSIACSADEDIGACSCAAVADYLGDIGSVRTEAFTTSASFASASGVTVRALADFAVARAAYDASFAANKTASARAAVGAAVAEIAGTYAALANLSFAPLYANVDLAAGCLSTRSDTNGTACFGGALQDARDLFGSYEATVALQLEVAGATFEAYVTKAEAYVDRVSEAYEDVAAFYEGVTAWMSALDTDYVSLPTDDWFRLGLGDFYAYKGIWPVAPALPALPGADSLYPASLAAVYEQLVRNLTLASLETSARAYAMLAEMATVPALDALGYADYHPPEYAGVANVSAAYSVEAEAFVRKQAVALNAFAELSAAADDAASFPAYNFSYDISYSAKSQSLLYDWAPLAQSRFDFTLLVAGLSSVSWLLLVLDYVWRTYHSARLVRKFWSRSALNMPAPDMRIDRPAGPGALGGCCSVSPQRLALSVVFSPVAGAVLLGVFVVLVTATVANAYVPVFRQYVSICVEGQGTRDNGTFIAQNLFSVAFNYASSDGRTTHAEKQDAYDTRRSEACAAYVSTSAEHQREDDLYCASLATAQSASSENAYRFSRCVDTDALDAVFERDCCGLFGYAACEVDLADNSTARCALSTAGGAPYLPLGAYLAAPSCDVDAADWVLEDAILDCEDDLPDCPRAARASPF